MKKIKKDEIKVWAFWSIDDGHLFYPDVCPIFSSRWEAREEKKKHEIYYSCTKIVPCAIRPL